MLFYNTPSPAPNPRRVRIFAAEKGIELPTKDVSLIAGEHKAEDYLKINPRGQTPALQLDDGSALSESVAICKYLEGLHPEPNLFGTDMHEAAFVEMWNRRVEMALMSPVGQVWVHTHPFTAAIPWRNAEWGETNRPFAESAFRFFDDSLEGREFIASDRFTISDILLLTTFDFAQFVGCGAPEDCANLQAWHERVSARPSATA